jgi:hypothetical protein
VLPGASSLGDAGRCFRALPLLLLLLLLADTTPPLAVLLLLLLPSRGVLALLRLPLGLPLLWPL